MSNWNLWKGGRAGLLWELMSSHITYKFPAGGWVTQPPASSVMSSTKHPPATQRRIGSVEDEGLL